MNKLIRDLKDLINDLRIEESIAQEAGNDSHYSGLCRARVKIEMCLEENGIARSSTIDNTASNRRLL